MGIDDDDIIRSGVTTELVGLGGPNGQEDPDLIGSDAWRKSTEEPTGPDREDIDLAHANTLRDDSIFDRFRQLEENKPGSAEDALELEETFDGGAPRERSTQPETPAEAPQQRTALTRESAVNLLKRHTRVDDAMLEGLGEDLIISWAERVQPLWRESQQNFQRVKELENATPPPRAGEGTARDDGVDVFAPIREHSEEAAHGEPSAQPSPIGVNFDDLERELGEELGDTGKKLVATLKTVAAENQSLRQQVSQTASRQEQRDVTVELERLATSTYPQLANNKKLQRDIYEQAVRQVRTGQYDSYGQLIDHAALLVLGSPRGGTDGGAGARDLDRRDRGTPSVQGTRVPGGASTHSMSGEDRAYDMFQKLEAEKNRKETLGIPY